MKKKREQKKLLKDKQRNYLQHWNPYQQKKQYTALQDPHANYYFYNKSVSNHLKDLKKAINHQRNQKQKQKLKQLITSKLTTVKLPTIKQSPKTAIYSNEINKSISSLPKHSRKRSELTIPSQQKQRDDENKNDSSFSVTEMKRYRRTNFNSGSDNSKDKSMTKMSVKIQNLILDGAEKDKILEKEIKEVEIDQLNRQLEKSHRESHAKFLEFIVEKKKKLEQTRRNNEMQYGQIQAKQSI